MQLIVCVVMTRLAPLPAKIQAIVLLAFYFMYFITVLFMVRDEGRLLVGARLGLEDVDAELEPALGRHKAVRGRGKGNLHDERAAVDGQHVGEHAGGRVAARERVDARWPVFAYAGCIRGVVP